MHSDPPTWLWGCRYLPPYPQPAYAGLQAATYKILRSNGLLVDALAKCTRTDQHLYGDAATFRPYPQPTYAGLQAATCESLRSNGLLVDTAAKCTRRPTYCYGDATAFRPYPRPACAGLLRSLGGYASKMYSDAPTSLWRGGNCKSGNCAAGFVAANGLQSSERFVGRLSKQCTLPSRVARQMPLELAIMEVSPSAVRRPQTPGMRSPCRIKTEVRTLLSIAFGSLCADE